MAGANHSALRPPRQRALGGLLPCRATFHL
jgi:hypothetical protein